MAERQATIRFKVEGIQGVSGTLAQLSKEIQANQVRIERAQKVVMQKTAGGVDTGESLTKLKTQLERQKQLYTDVAFATENSIYQIKRQMMDRSFGESLRAAKGNAEAQRAITQTYAMESKALADAEAAERVKIAGTRIKAEDKAASEISKSNVSSLSAERKAAEAFRTEELKQLREGMQARAKTAEAETKLAQKVSADKAKIAKQSAAERDKIDDAHFAATHTKQEAELRQLYLDYAKRRQAHRGNATALRQIDETYAADRNKILGMTGAGGGGGGAHGRWQPGGYKTPAFGSMSDRFTAMFSVANVASDITGDKSGARELGMAASGFLLGSPVFGTINAAATAVGLYFRMVREGEEKAKEATESYTASIKELSSAWRELSTASVDRNSFGRSMEGEMRRSYDSIIKINAELERQPELLQKIAMGWQVFFGTPFEELGPQKARGLNEAKLALENITSDEARLYRDAEYGRQLNEKNLILRATEDVYAAEAGGTGLTGLAKSEDIQKKRSILANIKQSIRERELTDRADAGVAMTDRIRREANRQAMIHPEINTLVVAERRANQDYMDAKDARNKLDKQFQSERDALGIDQSKEMQTSYWGPRAEVDKSYQKGLRDARIGLYVKQGRLSQGEAYLIKAMQDDPNANLPGPIGDRIRASIFGQALAQDAGKDEAAKPFNAGAFSTQFAAGYVSFAHLNQDRQMQPAEKSAQLLERISAILERIEQNGGLN